MSILARNTQIPILLRPSRYGMNDRIDLWYAHSGKIRYVMIKRFILLFAKLLKMLTGVILVPTLSLAIKKGV